MTDKELKRLSRAELLEMLLMQSREVEQLKQELDQLRGEVEDRRLRLENTGNIAQAALQLNGVFEAAQAAADQFVENVSGMEEETVQRCREMTERTELECREMTEQAERECREMRDKAEEEAKSFWRTIRDEIEEASRDHVWRSKIVGEVDDHIEKLSQGGAYEE